MPRRRPTSAPTLTRDAAADSGELFTSAICTGRSHLPRLLISPRRPATSVTGLGIVYRLLAYATFHPLTDAPSTVSARSLEIFV